MHAGRARRQTLRAVLGITSPQKATVRSSGSSTPSSAPELATLIITVGTQKMAVMRFSRRNSGRRRGKRNSDSGVSTSLAPHFMVP